MNLKDLIKRFNEDQDFEAKFMELDSEETISEFIAKEGYSISPDDILALHRELEYLETGRAELSDDELDQVAGGFMPPAMPMGQVGGPQPDWVVKLVNIFIDKTGIDKAGSKSTVSKGTATKGTINAQSLPSVGVQDMATTSLPNLTGMPGANKIPFGAINPLDQPEKI